MSEGSTITPLPVAGQQVPAWMRWLDCYAQEHAAAVAQITQEADGETMTPGKMQLVVTLRARLGCRPRSAPRAVHPGGHRHPDAGAGAGERAGHPPHGCRDRRLPGGRPPDGAGAPAGRWARRAGDASRKSGKRCNSALAMRCTGSFATPHVEESFLGTKSVVALQPFPFVCVNSGLSSVSKEAPL